ncbi:MAG: glycosyltransferase [Gemmatimonadales bacterium]|jgi:glycosyltransferase involved in cell wall biosynthesis
MTNAAPPRFSLIIPARNEAALLPRLLATVEAARSRYHDGPAAIEVIVADNLSTDDTAAIARRHGCRVTQVETRAIAAVRNGGAAVARGEILAFVDADSRIHPDTFNAIDRALRSGRVIGGATGVKLERWSLGIWVTYVLLVSLVVLSGMDTGVVFCRREDFEAIGGYDERRLVAEDVVFLWTLRRRGRARGQKLARVTEAKAIACMRKFDQFGDWHYFTRLAPGIIRAIRSRTAEEELGRRFWYDVR